MSVGACFGEFVRREVDSWRVALEVEGDRNLSGEGGVSGGEATSTADSLSE